jgi:hypothetical protein
VPVPKLGDPKLGAPENTVLNTLVFWQKRDCPKTVEPNPGDLGLTGRRIEFILSSSEAPRKFLGKSEPKGKTRRQHAVSVQEKP